MKESTMTELKNKLCLLEETYRPQFAKVEKIIDKINKQIKDNDNAYNESKKIVHAYYEQWNLHFREKNEKEKEAQAICDNASKQNKILEIARNHYKTLSVFIGSKLATEIAGLVLPKCESLADYTRIKNAWNDEKHLFTFYASSGHISICVLNDKGFNNSKLGVASNWGSSWYIENLSNALAFSSNFKRYHDEIVERVKSENFNNVKVAEIPTLATVCKVIDAKIKLFEKHSQERDALIEKQAKQIEKCDPFGIRIE